MRGSRIAPSAALRATPYRLVAALIACCSSAVQRDAVRGLGIEVAVTDTAAEGVFDSAPAPPAPVDCPQLVTSNEDTAQTRSLRPPPINKS